MSLVWLEEAGMPDKWEGLVTLFTSVVSVLFSRRLWEDNHVTRVSGKAEDDVSYT